MLHKYLWWFEWIICWKVNGKKEDTTLVRTVRLQKQHIAFTTYKIQFANNSYKYISAYAKNQPNETKALFRHLVPLYTIQPRNGLAYCTFPVLTWCLKYTLPIIKIL